MEDVHVGSAANLAVLTSVSVLAMATSAGAATFFGPTPYLSAADIPAGFYAGGPTILEDFEDGTLDPFFAASAGIPIGPGGSTDSVDGDDGAIDGSGTAGRSYFSGAGSAGITFSFAAPVSAAGIVWTDGAGTIRFEAFAPGGASLGTIGPVSDPGVFPDGGFGGTTAEDRFFGVTNAGGIGSIFISNSSGGIEIDHLHVGDMFVSAQVPLPAGLPLYLGALAVGGLVMRKRG
jgi:hypothetical protein